MEDGPLAAVNQSLRQLNTPTLFIDQRRVLDYKLELETDGAVAGRITGPDFVFDIGCAQSVYLRQYNLENLDSLCEVPRGSQTWRQAVQFEEAMMLWCELTEARVVNRPSAMGSNNSKPHQLALIKEAGFAVPDTLITSDPDCALAFWKQHGRVIYKSISSCRSIVSQLGEDDVSAIQDVVCCPTQFQQFIAGIDYRAHVLRDKVIAHEITSADDDYRYSKQVVINPTALPRGIEEKCLHLSNRLGLLFSGVDLRRSSEDEWYCFEVNPSPGFTYFEQGGNEISSELANLLS